MTDDELNRLADAHVKKLDAMPPPKRKRVDAPMDGVVVARPGQSIEEARAEMERDRREKD